MYAVVLDVVLHESGSGCVVIRVVLARGSSRERHVRRVNNMDACRFHLFSLKTAYWCHDRSASTPLIALKLVIG